MAVRLGTRGNNGRTLVRDKKKFDSGYDQINWKSRKKDVDKPKDKSQDKPA